jgi:hypothetical protein
LEFSGIYEEINNYFRALFLYEVCCFYRHPFDAGVLQKLRQNIPFRQRKEAGLSPWVQQRQPLAQKTSGRQDSNPVVRKTRREVGEDEGIIRKDTPSPQILISSSY